MTIEDYDKLSLEWHTQLMENKITLEEYKDNFDKIQNQIKTSGIKTNIFSRKDTRTLGEWAVQIHTTTERERILVEEFFEGQDATITDYGVENSGLVLFGSHPSYDKPDFQIEIGGKSQLVEFKFNPSFKKATFKERDLKNYEKHNSMMLMICENGGIRHWQIYDTDEIREMLKLPIKEYWEVGGKQAVQLTGKKLYLRHWKDRKDAIHWWEE